MGVDDGAHRKAGGTRQREAIAGDRRVTIERVEEPHRGVRRVIEPRAPPGNMFGMSPSRVASERAEDLRPPRSSAGRQREAFRRIIVSRPHSVGEPVVSGDDRAEVVAHRVRLEGVAEKRDHGRIGNASAASTSSARWDGASPPSGAGARAARTSAFAAAGETRGSSPSPQWTRRGDLFAWCELRLRSGPGSHVEPCLS